jgi:hypothetical protein
MAQLSTKIKKYLADNGVNSVDFTTDVLLQDDSNGQGPYIKEWNIDGVAKPTADQLNAFEAAASVLKSLMLRSFLLEYLIIWFYLKPKSRTLLKMDFKRK